MATELQRLRDRIEELEQVLGIDRSMVNRIRGALQVTRDQAKMLAMLIGRNVVTREAMYAVIYGARPVCDQPDVNMIDMQLSKLRRSLAPHGVAVRTLWGEGWQISIDDKAKVRRVIASVDVAALTQDGAAR